MSSPFIILHTLISDILFVLTVYLPVWLKASTSYIQLFQIVVIFYYVHEFLGETITMKISQHFLEYF